MGFLKRVIRVNRTHGRNFWRSLIIFLVIASLPTLAIGISSYYIGVQQIETEVMRTHYYQFQNILKEINKKLSQLELIVGRNSFSPVFTSKLRNLHLPENVESINNIYQSLMVIKGLSPSINDVLVYFNQSGICLSNETGYFSIMDDNEKKWYDSILEQKKGIIWMNDTSDHIEAKKHPNIFITCKIPGYSTDPYGVMIVSVNIEEVTDSLQSFSWDGDGLACLVDENNSFLVFKGNKEASANSLLSIINRKLADEKIDNGSFSHRFGDKNYSVVFGKLDINRWILFAATPFNQLTKPVSNTSRLLIIVSAIGFIAAILLALLGFLRAWRPVNKLFEYICNYSEGEIPDDEVKFIKNKWQQLINEKRSLTERLEKDYPVLRHAFFLQLIQGHLNSFDEIVLREKVKNFEWDVSGKSFMMIGVQISKATDFKKFGDDNDNEEVITFAASNIIEEITVKNFIQSYIINLQNMMIGLMMLFDDSKHINQVRNEAYVLCEKVILMLKECIGINATICIGKPLKLLTGVNKEFKEICRALKYRDIKKDTQIIETETGLVKDEAIAHDFPVNIEKEIAQALKMGAGDESSRLINVFFNEIKQNNGKEYYVKQSMIQLLGYIQYELFYEGVDVYSVFEENLFEQLYQIKDLGNISKWYENKVIIPYITYLNKTQNIKLKRLVGSVIKTIEEQYKTDISLEWCADLHNTYPQKLSAIFKVVTGLNFIDYLSKYRIEKSKELLKYTGKSINDIAKSVGYQPSYFNRIFKKYEGITPGDFRKAKGDYLNSQIFDAYN